MGGGRLMVGVRIFNGDVLDMLRALPGESVHACITDPPYHLTAGKKGGSGAASLNESSPAGRARIGTGFMGMAWDGGDVAMRAETWAEVLRVLKPGAHLLAFGGTRTHHRIWCAIEDAGFEVRDTLGWLYGSGFPKGTDKAKIPADWQGWNTALKPAWEPIILARKPMVGTLVDNLAAHGVGAMNIDSSRVGTTDLGRWPANILHDGSDEVLSLFPESRGQIADASSSSRKTQNSYGAMKRGNEAAAQVARGDAGSAARFFWCPKASRSDREEGNTHPTVKPTELMRYLVRLVTSPGDTVLDPFAGSGTTLRVALELGRGAIGIELNPDYCTLIERRLHGVQPLVVD